jgi:RNA polymerase sigma factor (sigma-70 family)
LRPLPHEERIQHQFDSICKTTAKYAARDYYRKLNRRKAREIVFSELPEQDLAKLFVTDRYFKDAFGFDVQGYLVAISDERLAEAMNAIPTDSRDIILLAYFLDMSDLEIAERLNLVRRTVAYRRVKTLRELKKIMEGMTE